MTRLEGWSLSEADWRRLARLLDEVEWRITQLRSLNQDDVPSTAGVYILMTDSQRVSDQYRLPKGIANVLYVGRSTTSLRKRFLDHASDSPDNPLIKISRRTFGELRYAYARAPGNDSNTQKRWVRDAESALISVLSPPANRNVPQASPMTARLTSPQPIGI